MSPASKLKSKDKSTLKAGKEQSKNSMKPSTMHSNIAQGSPASTYNPAMGTVHDVEISSSFSPPQSNGRFKTIDDPDDHSTSSQSTTAEYDSSSNNSYSGDSEDQKDKPTIPSPQADTFLCSDNDKRDKNRQKNERKHQRQKEKRAQELHERCTAFLTSRKLEALSLQLVAMGFPADRATMAVIINKGRMEECVAWLLQEGDDNKQPVSVNLEDKSCVTIDITEELARITKMEVKYKCLRQDVERAVVACEGDLLKAEENLRVHKRVGESVDSMKLHDKESTPNNSPVLIKHPIKGATTIAIAQKRQEGRDCNLSKTVPNPTDWPRNQAAPVDKRWSTTSIPISSASPVQASVPPAKKEARFGATTNEVRSIFPAEAPKVPFVVMRRPNEPLPSMEILTAANSDMGNKLSVMGKNGSTVQHFYPQNNPQSMTSSPVELSASARWSGHLWNASGASSSPLTTMSSPGLFTGWGLSASSQSSSPRPNGWNTYGSTPNRDYTSIDWSLDLTPLRPSLKIDVMSDTWSTMFMGGNAIKPYPPPPHTNGGGGIYLPGLQEVGGLLPDPSGPGSSQEWSSPFEGRDLFRIPRKYVTSPSM